MPEKLVESLYGGAAVGEGREWLHDLADFAIHHQLLAFPVAGEAFEEVVAFYVAVVVRERDVGWIHVNQITARFHLEHIAAGDGVPFAVAENGVVVGFHLLDEVLADAELEIPASVLVAGWIADCEKSARLALDRGTQQRGQGHGALERGIQLADAGPEVIQRGKFVWSVENAFEGAADEAFRFQTGFGGEQEIKIRLIQPGGVVGDRGRRENGWKRQRVVGSHLLAHGLEQVGDHARAGERIGSRIEVQIRECLVNPRQKPEFAAHVAEPGEIRHHLRKPWHGMDQGDLEIDGRLHGFF